VASHRLHKKTTKNLVGCHETLCKIEFPIKLTLSTLKHEQTTIVKHMTHMGVGGQGDLGPPWIFKFAEKKVIFLVSSRNHHFWHALEKLLKKTISAPSLEKILPTPSLIVPCIT